MQRLPEEAEVSHANGLRDLIVGLQALLQAGLHKLEVPRDLPQQQAHQHQPLGGCRPEPNGARGCLQGGRAAGWHCMRIKGCWLAPRCCMRLAGNMETPSPAAALPDLPCLFCNGGRALGASQSIKTRGMASCMSAEVPPSAAAVCQPASPCDDVITRGTATHKVRDRLPHCADWRPKRLRCLPADGLTLQTAVQSTFVAACCPDRLSTADSLTLRAACWKQSLASV